jgi:hypothetical protein
MQYKGQVITGCRDSTPLIEFLIAIKKLADYFVLAQ